MSIENDIEWKKESVYVFGCGQYFKNMQPEILEKYDITAVLDNNREGEIELLNGRCVPVLKPEDAVGNQDIPIILMVRDFYSIWMQLKNLGIASSRILFPNIFSSYADEGKAFNSTGGTFQIINGDIWYVGKNKRYLIESTEMLYDLPKRLERDHVSALFLTEQAPIRPLNRAFGFTRGTPIDRYYIENWLESNKGLICGDVLEIAEDTYTKRFGMDNAVSHIFHVNAEKEGVIKGNLETGEGIEKDSMDCVILTQTVGFIYECRNVISNIYKMLRKGGNALITTGGISQISRYDMDHWGHFWGFTTASLKRLIEESGFGSNYEMTVYGNVKTACALLYGVSAEELCEEELAYFDEDYPVSICMVLKK